MMLATTLTHSDLTDLVVRLAVDLLSIGTVAALFWVRHQRRDLVLVFTTFNIGVFTVLTVITERTIPAGVGFGLFALLSIIRLRSEPFANVDLGYFFLSLVLAVVNGIGHVDHRLTGFLCVLVIVAVYLIDHPRIQRTTIRVEVILDSVITNQAALRLELKGRFGSEIVAMTIVEVDYVRETMRVWVTYVEGRPELSGPRPLGTLETAR
jgi:hypothetical protein